MKKIIIITVLAISSASFGDLAIKWNNDPSPTAGLTLTQDQMGLLPSGTYAALIWSATAPNSETVLLPTGVANTGGEFLLSWTLTNADGAGINVGATKFTNAKVGGNDINAGYFFTRIFDTATVADNNYYRQSIATGPVLVEAPSGDTLPPELNNGVNGYSASAFSSFGAVDTQYTVVPEPATVGLFGLGALSAWIIRRNKQKATEEA